MQDQCAAANPRWSHEVEGSSSLASRVERWITGAVSPNKGHRQVDEEAYARFQCARLRRKPVARNSARRLVTEPRATSAGPVRLPRVRRSASCWTNERAACYRRPQSKRRNLGPQRRSVSLTDASLTPELAEKHVPRRRGVCDLGPRLLKDFIYLWRTGHPEGTDIPKCHRPI